MKISPTRQKTSPTEDFYGLLKDAFDHFNHDLFNGQLPSCLITVQREKNTMGYFSPNRWGNRLGDKAHEIALNPSYFSSHKFIEIFQTLVHEQCHMWQHIHGKPSRSGYHNKQWAEKMESIGLMPSDTGLEGGKKTGQKMSDYPIKGGLFTSSCENLVSKGYQLNWIDRIPATTDSAQPRNHTKQQSPHPSKESKEILDKKISELMPSLEPINNVQQKRKKKSKTKYQCVKCNASLWGKPGMTIFCGETACCQNSKFEEFIN